MTTAVDLFGGIGWGFACRDLAVITPCVAVWIAPRHPQSIHARRNQRGWDG